MPKWALKFCKKPNLLNIKINFSFFIILFCIFIITISSLPSFGFETSNKKLLATPMDVLPHCTRNVLMEGNISDELENISFENIVEKKNYINVTSSSQFFMSLNETTCIILMVII